MAWEKQTRSPAVWPAEQGAMMVLGLFLACLLVGLPYYMICARDIGPFTTYDLDQVMVH